MLGSTESGPAGLSWKSGRSQLAVTPELATHMFLDVSSDLLAEGQVLRHGSADDRVEGSDERRHGCRREET